MINIISSSTVLATFWTRGNNMINIINISPVLSTYLEKVRKTREQLIMLITFCVFLIWGVPHSFWGINIINTSPVLVTFWNIINISLVLATF